MIKKTSSYNLVIQPKDIIDFLAWAENTHALAPREIPPCWAEHPALIDILASLAAERALAVSSVSHGVLETDRLVVWWIHFEQMRGIWGRWTDNCRIDHTPDQEPVTK